MGNHLNHICLSILFMAALVAAAPAASTAQARRRPDSLLLPITKDQITKRYFSVLNIGAAAPATPRLLLDLDSQFALFDYSKSAMASSTFRLIRCGSTVCKSIPGSQCDAVSKTCTKTQYDPVTNSTVVGRVSLDRATFGSATAGRFSLRRFLFLCSAGAKPAATPVLGLSGGSQSLATQLSSAFNIPPKFSLCLPTYGTGRLYVGTVFNSLSWILTPLRVNPSGYSISLSSIAVDGRPVPLNSALLSTDKNGNGGTKICTLSPYTIFHSDIYKPVADGFAKRMAVRGIQTAAAVVPFGLCFNASTIAKNAPVMDLVVPARMGVGSWRLYASNTLVRVSQSTTCFGFVDGGKAIKAGVVVGGYQMENYLIEFDLSRSVLGISSPLGLSNTTCSTFVTGS